MVRASTQEILLKFLTAQCGPAVVDAAKNDRCAPPLLPGGGQASLKRACGSAAAALAATCLIIRLCFTAFTTIVATTIAQRPWKPANSCEIHARLRATPVRHILHYNALVSQTLHLPRGPGAAIAARADAAARVDDALPWHTGAIVGARSIRWRQAAQRHTHLPRTLRVACTQLCKGLHRGGGKLYAWCTDGSDVQTRLR